MKTFLKLCSKTVKAKNGAEFLTYFAYPVNVVDGKATDVLSKDGKAHSIPFKYSKELQKTAAAISLPVVVSVEDGKDYSIIDDKKKDGTPRLDQNGAQRKILILKNFTIVDTIVDSGYTISDALGL